VHRILHYDPTNLKLNKESFNSWVILLNLVHSGNFQFLAMFYNVAANEQGFVPKTSKIYINTH